MIKAILSFSSLAPSSRHFLLTKCTGLGFEIYSWKFVRMICCHFSSALIHLILNFIPVEERNGNNFLTLFLIRSTKRLFFIHSFIYLIVTQQALPA